MDLDGAAKRVALRQDDQLVAELRVRPGLPRRAMFRTTIPSLPMTFGDAAVV